MKKVKVLHFSPHNENDGIAKYQEQYVAGMAKNDLIKNDFFEATPNWYRHLPAVDKQAVLTKLKDKLKNYDIFHIQHEFGLFDNEDFATLFSVAKMSGVKTIITVHLSPGFAIKPVSRGGFGPRSVISYIRDLRHRARMIERHVKPMLEADRLIVHNDVTANSLIEFGANSEKIIKLPHPVYEWDVIETTSYIKNALNYQKGDILYCTVGMLHRYKGIFDAVRALTFLPDNYKLAILGGMHPMSDEVKIYNKICDLIQSLGLQDRVFITGFVEDDNKLNSYIAECDISVFPYDGYYYGHLSSGSINLALSIHSPVVAYPTAGFKELAYSANGAVVLCQTYSYYELAREIKRVNTEKQKILSKEYAHHMSWKKMSQKLLEVYDKV